MRLDVTLEGKRRRLTVEEGKVTVDDGPSLAVRVVDDGDDRVELEIAGEKVVIEGWIPGRSDPPKELVVNGERTTAAVERTGPATARPPSAPTAPRRTSTAASSEDGVPILPPMPGRVVDLRVKDGDRVPAGQVLLVLEAMKMRNEIASPVAGVVHGVAVTVGASVQARETMLRIVPA